MVRLVHVTVPQERASSIKPLLATIEDTHGLVELEGRDNTLFTFRIKEKKMQMVMDSLMDMGVGRSYGHVDIIQLEMTYPRLPKTRTKRAYRWDDRKTMEEIYQCVDSGVHLTFDYLCFIVVASCICAGGLITDSSVLVVASMLVSPLMGPILGLTFGATIGDVPMAKTSFRNECIGMLLTFGMGAMIGLVLGQFSTVNELTTDEMSDRGTWIALLVGIGIAIPSGVGVAIATTSEGVSALVGVAISASLLPPIVNSGINFSFSFIQKYRDNGLDGSAPLTIAVYSLSLFLLNWVLILVGAMVTFRLKRVGVTSKSGSEIKLMRAQSGSMTNVVGSINEPSAKSASLDAPLLSNEHSDDMVAVNST